MSSKVNKSCENLRKLSIKSVITHVLVGFIIGFALTIYWHIKYSQTYKKPFNAGRWIFLEILLFFILVLCYGRGVRCVLTLILPILCSSKGRTLMIALAFILVATGPTYNLIRNVAVLTKSMACGQQQLKEALGNMLDVIKKPLVAIKDAIAHALSEIRKVMAKMEKVLKRIQALVMVLLAGIKNAFSWLGSIVKMCNKEFGTPFDRCMRIANDAIEDCRLRLGSFKFLCNVTHVFSLLCYTVKVIDVICIMVAFLNDSIIKTVLEQLQKFADEIKKMFDVSITFKHDFYFKTVASKNLTQIGDDILKDVHLRMDAFLMIFGYLDAVGSAMLFLVIIKAIYFKMKYLRNVAYHNHILTKDFMAIDEKRKTTGQELVLPLRWFEKRKYVKITSCRLTQAELFGLARSTIFLMISTIQIFCLCYIDYCLYWLLAMISYHGHQRANVEVPPYITVDVKGGGLVREIFEGIIHAFEPLSEYYSSNTTICLPIPRQPNYLRYYQIGLVVLMAWIFMFLQPYGLRLRHLVMRLYYPNVAKQRASWLYSQILLKRMSFFKFARRKARAIFMNDGKVDNFTFLDWLRAKTDRYCICRLLLGKRKVNTACIICSQPLKDKSKVSCETLGCRAVYCKSCYEESKNICCICKSPLEYGDLSDVSEARDSSDDPDALHVDSNEKICN